MQSVVYLLHPCFLDLVRQRRAEDWMSNDPSVETKPLIAMVGSVINHELMEEWALRMILRDIVDKTSCFSMKFPTIAL